MKYLVNVIFTVILSLSLTTFSVAGEEGHKMGGSGQGIKSMSREDLIKLALSAAPHHIAKDAAVMIPDEDGKMVEVKKGTNGFTCIPTVNNRPEPDPMCMDPAVNQWVNDLMSNAPKPTNTVPGISYMARGGMHWEKDGKILMKEEPGSKMVKEPPHWMVRGPSASKDPGLPLRPIQRVSTSCLTEHPMPI